MKPKLDQTRMFLNVLLLPLLALATSATCEGKKPSPKQIVLAAAGDFGMTADATATFEAMARAKPDIVLALGDFSYNGSIPESDWCKYVKSKLLVSIPVQLIAGNHEDDYEGTGHLNNFASCFEDRMQSVGEYGKQYYFDHERLVRFILISPDLTIAGRHFYYGDGNAEYKWVSDAIDSARRARFKWVIVGMHKSCLSMGQYYCRIYADLMNLLVEKRVDLVLQAHDHTYQRTKQLALGPLCEGIAIDGFNPKCIADDGQDNRYRKGRGPVFVIAGTGGADLFEIDPKDSEAGYFVKWMGKNITPRKGFVKITVSKKQVSEEFVGVTNTSSFTDSFVITEH